jgi:hypothetical protein
LTGYLIREQSLCGPTIAFGKDSSIITFDKTSFTVTIPADVGPSGRHYVLAARIMNTDGSHYTSQVFSDVFELTGANGAWAEFQKDGMSLWGDDGMSCTGWSCVKDCATTAKVRAWMVAMSKKYYNCINACPDVSVRLSPSHDGVDGGPLIEPPACPSVPSASPTPNTLEGVPSKTYALPPSDEADAAYTGAAASREHSSVFETALFISVLMALVFA